MDFTPGARLILMKSWHRLQDATKDEAEAQRNVLRSLLSHAVNTETGKKYHFQEIAGSGDIEKSFRNTLPAIDYESIRDDVMRMISGEKNILWPGVCKRFAQSSGTSGGKSKYIPITEDSLHLNHYPGAALSVASYLAHNPDSALFSGKGLVLGGSFENELNNLPKGVKVGDLSASLIDAINPLANIFRVPDKHTALLADWNIKLPALAEAAARANVTNLSGVPSWLMTVLRKVLEITGKENILEVWPNLEVFFHGGISFDPYREEYSRLIPSPQMHYLETYNASEGFFAIQDDPASRSMLLLPDSGIYYEFIPLGGDSDSACSMADVVPGKIYELVITSCNGLWRYRIGDTIEITSKNPVKIRIAGRTKTFINAFGEELMESNAEKAIAAATARTACSIANYTAAPVYAHDGERGRHQWLVEWNNPPADISEFAEILDEELRKVNSDYNAKRSGEIFLAMPEIITARHGLFSEWLSETGSGKIGGQRKVPRLSNNREIMQRLLEINGR